MRYVLFLGMLGLTLVTSGCFTVWSQLKSNLYTDTKAGFSTQVPLDWMKYNHGKDFFLMTHDGIVLNRVGVSKHKIDDDLGFTKKRFNRSMLPQDLAEVEVDNFRSDESISHLLVESIEPVTIDGRNGFKMVYSLTRKGGLKKKGLVYGFLLDEVVYRISFEAAEQHYFAAALPVFEQFIKHFKAVL